MGIKIQLSKPPKKTDALTLRSKLIDLPFQNAHLTCAHMHKAHAAVKSPIGGGLKFHEKPWASKSTGG